MEKSCFGKSVDVTRIICEALPYMVKEKRKKTGSVYIAFLSSKEEPDILRGYDVEDNQIMGYGDADFAEDLEAGLFSQCEVTQTMNVTTKCSDGEKFERQKNGMTCD